MHSEKIFEQRRMRLRLLLSFFFFGLANGRELVAVVENGTESYNLTATFRPSRNRNSGKLSVLMVYCPASSCMVRVKKHTF